MSEMVERVAKVVGTVLSCDSTGECLLIATDRQCEEIARAVIAAMRTPTPEMLETGLMAGTNLTTGQPSARLAARTAGERMTDQWQAMIDAALK